MSDALVAERKLTIRQIATSPALWITLAVALAGGLATLAFLFWGKPDPDSGKSTTSGAMPVRTIQAQSVDSVTFPREFVGEVQARRTSDLAFERPARITHILVDDGDKVVAQQVLAQLDVSDLEIAKRKAQAAKANAEAVLTELKDGARQEVIEAAEAERDAKVAERDLAKFIRDQRAKLAENAISPEERNQVEAKYQSAKAEARAAQSRLDELVEGVRQEKIQAQEALVKQLNEEIEDVKLQIEKSALKAPFAGSVALRYLDEGVVVSSWTTRAENYRRRSFGSDGGNSPYDALGNLSRPGNRNRTTPIASESASRIQFGLTTKHVSKQRFDEFSRKQIQTPG